MVAGSVGATVVVGGYLLSFQGGISVDQAVWGQFGDFVGGLLNPFLALLALIVLGHTLRLQGMQMKAAEEDARKERFEATAAHWFNMWLDSLASIREGSGSGVEAVRGLLDSQLAPGLRRARIERPGLSDAEILCAGVAEFMAGPGDKVRHYLATLGVLARFLQRGLFAPRRDERALQQLLALDGDWFGAGYRARLGMIRALDLRPRLAEVRCPVALFAADHDRVVSSVRCAQELAAGLPDAELTLLSRAGHLVLALAAEPWEERLERLARRAGIS